MATKVMLMIAANNVSGPLKGVFQLFDNISPDHVRYRVHGFQSKQDNELDAGHSFFDVFRERGIQVDLLYQRNKNYFSLVVQVIRAIKSNNYDIIQTHGFKPTFLAFWARLFCNIKWICFMHGTTRESLKVRMYNLVDNIFQLGADRTVLVSEAQRQKVFGGRNTRRVRVLHNAVDVSDPMPRSANGQPVRQALGIPRECKVIVAVGRFSPEKGMDVLLDAFALLVQQLDNVHLIIVGDGQERAALETKTQNLGLADKVHFPGYCETAGDYVFEADVLALPSRSEGIPNAVLEAMAMTRPVVATAVGGVPEIIQDGISGRLVPPEHPSSFAKALSDVLSDPVYGQQLADQGRERVLKAFSIQSRVDKLLSIYGDLLGKNK